MSGDTKGKLRLVRMIYGIDYKVEYKCPDDMTTEEAVRYLEHGPEMADFIHNCQYVWKKDADRLRVKATKLTAKLEGK